MLEPSPDAFLGELRRQARRVHARQLLHGSLWGAVGGSVTSAAAVGILWWQRFEPRTLGLVPIVVGGIIGAAVGFARRFSLGEVALYLDARLVASEAVSSAWSTRSVETSPARAVRARAASLLRAAEPRRTRLGAWSRFHLAAVPAIVAALWLCRIPLPERAAYAKPRGSELVRRGPVPGLERIEALAGATALSAGDAERLKRLAEEAKRLNQELARGLEKRDAQARMAALRDGVSSLRQRFGDRGERAGLEAALGALGAERSTERAAKALGAGDIVAFDEEMQRLANQAESAARDSARRTLAEAERRASDKGAKQLSEMLARQRKSFAEREARMRALRELERELGEKLGPEARKDLAELDRSGDPEAARRLAESLARALTSMSPAERKKLAEALKRRMSDDASKNGASRDRERSMTSEEMERFLRGLESEAGQRALAEQLRELARNPNADAERERALDDAERGGAEAERGLGGNALPLPLPGKGGSPNPSDSGQRAGAGTNPGSGTSSGRGGGPENHQGGGASRIDADELRAQARGRWLPGAPLAARSLGRAPGRAGETANELGVGNLESRAAGEVGAVEGADIPEEYREHVGRYFEP
jgi:hypothetical protein